MWNSIIIIIVITNYYILYETTYHTQEQKHTAINFILAKEYRYFHEMVFSISSLDMFEGGYEIGTGEKIYLVRF